MPKRTNDFQKLVKNIQTLVCPSAEVAESVEVTVPGFGHVREVDVVVETEIGLYPVKLAVEAKDESRKMSVDRMESLISKYTGPCSLSFDKVIIVNSKGYTKKALEKARACGFQCMTLSELDDSDGRLEGIAISNELFLQQKPHLARIRVFAEGNEIQQKELNAVRFYCLQCEAPHGGAPEMCRKLFMQKFDESQTKNELEKSWRKMGGFCLPLSCEPENLFLGSADGAKIDKISFHVHAMRLRFPKPKKYAFCDSEGGSTIFSQSQLRISSTDVKVLMCHGSQTTNIEP